MSEIASQSLCLSCGLCCDGTLFGYVSVKAGDDLERLKSIAIELDSDQSRFSQPCLAHENRTCSLYASRPEVCTTFRCKLLVRFSRNEVCYEKAMKVITETANHACELRKSLVEITGRKDASLKKLYLLAKDTGDPARHRLMLGYVALGIRLEKHFVAKPIIGSS